MANISVSEWLDECRRLERQNADDGWTLEELAATCGCSVRHAATIRSRLHREGRLQVGHRPAVDVRGRNFIQTVYSIKPEARANGKAKGK